MKLKEIMALLDQIAPFSLQESYDNSGIQLGVPDQDLHRGLVTLDLSPEVLQEAIQKKCDLIITHHPLLFSGLKRITGGSPTERMVIDAIRHGIAVVAMHTNLDNMHDGVNRQLAMRLGLSSLSILRPLGGMLRKLVTFCPTAHAEKLRAAFFQAGAGQIGDYDCCSFNVAGRGSFRAGEGTSPFVGNISELHYEEEERIEVIYPVFLEQKVLGAMRENHPYEEVAYDIYRLENKYGKSGSGILGELSDPLPATHFLSYVKECLGSPCLRHTDAGEKIIQRVALCGGSGSFLIPDALSTGADAFVTGDLKYHQFFDATDKMLLVDAGHYETEQYTSELIVDSFKKKNINFALLISEHCTNPIRYF